MRVVSGLVEQAAVGVAEINGDRPVHYSEHAALRDGRQDRGGVVATTFHAIASGDAHLHEEKTALLAAGKIGHSTWRSATSGSRGDRLGESHYVASLEAGGKTGHNMIVVKDITKRRRMEEALRKSEEEQRLLIEMLPLAVFVTPSVKSFTSIQPL